MKSALFFRFGENFRLVWPFWELWGLKMRFGQNVLRMIWKERLVQFLWKAHCLLVLKRISGQFHDFENCDAQKCDLAKTCCAWPESTVLYNFRGKRTVFPFWREFGASFTILRTSTLKNAIWPKRAAHDLKRAFCTIFMGKRTVFPSWREFGASVTILGALTLKNAIWLKRAANDLKVPFCTIFVESALFSCFEENFGPVSRFWELRRSKMRFGQNVLRMTWKERFVQFSWESELFSRLEENLGPVWRFWELWRLKMRFGQNVLRVTWKNNVLTRFSFKAHGFPVLKRIIGQCDDVENFAAQKCDLAKTCCAWPEKTVLYNFYEKRTVFPVWREFQASVTILRTLTLKNAIWPKRAPHDLKRAFCTIFMKSALFFRFGENFRPVWPFWELWGLKMRFGQNVLRMIWKERLVQFLWKAHCFLVLKRISGQFHDFENCAAQKCDLAKTCWAWPESTVLYNFRGKRTVFPFWREFRACLTILRTSTLKNAIWPKRAAHDLKRAFCTIFMGKRSVFPSWREFGASVTILGGLTLKNAICLKRAANDLKVPFCTIFMESALFSRFGENFRAVWSFWEICRLKMRFGQNVLRMTWKERFVQFPWRAHCFPLLKRIWDKRNDFEKFDGKNAIWPKRAARDLKK